MSPANNIYLLYILIPLAVIVSLGIPKAWRYWKSRESKDWPRVPGSFVDGKITLLRSKTATVPQLMIWFVYSADGGRWDGYYEETFNTLEDAEQILESLKTGPLFVRYNPADPAKYFVDPYADVRSPTSE